MTLSLRLKINGQPREVEIDDPRITLLDLLRERLALTGAKKGCDETGVREMVKHPFGALELPGTIPMIVGLSHDPLAPYKRNPGRRHQCAAGRANLVAKVNLRLSAPCLMM